MRQQESLRSPPSMRQHEGREYVTQTRLLLSGWLIALYS